MASFPWMFSFVLLTLCCRTSFTRKPFFNPEGMLSSDIYFGHLQDRDFWYSYTLYKSPSLIVDGYNKMRILWTSNNCQKPICHHNWPFYKCLNDTLDSGNGVISRSIRGRTQEIQSLQFSNESTPGYYIHETLIIQNESKRIAFEVYTPLPFIFYGRHFVFTGPRKKPFIKIFTMTRYTNTVSFVHPHLGPQTLKTKRFLAYCSFLQIDSCQDNTNYDFRGMSLSLDNKGMVLAGSCTLTPESVPKDSFSADMLFPTHHWGLHYVWTRFKYRFLKSPLSSKDIINEAVTMQITGAKRQGGAKHVVFLTTLKESNRRLNFSTFYEMSVQGEDYVSIRSTNLVQVSMIHEYADSLSRRGFSVYLHPTAAWNQSMKYIINHNHWFMHVHMLTYVFDNRAEHPKYTLSARPAMDLKQWDFITHYTPSLWSYDLTTFHKRLQIDCRTCLNRFYAIVILFKFLDTGTNIEIDAGAVSWFNIMRKVRPGEWFDTCMRQNVSSLPIIPGDRLDNDCDGYVDEETTDGTDNDMDGLVDEDIAAVNGNWGEWDTTAFCTVLCEGIGIVAYRRRCDNPPPGINGAYCSGKPTKPYNLTSTCDNSDVTCPYNCKDGTWDYGCVNPCSSGCVDTCDKWNGSCSYCRPGYEPTEAGSCRSLYMQEDKEDNLLYILVVGLALLASGLCCWSCLPVATIIAYEE